MADQQKQDKGLKLKLKVKAKGPDAEKLLKKIGFKKLKVKDGETKVKEP